MLLALGRWGAASPEPPRGSLGVDALLLALEATFRRSPKLAEGPLTLGLTVDGQPFGVTVTGTAITVARGAPRAPLASLRAGATTLRAVCFGDVRLDDAAVEITGDHAVAKAFLRSFVRPARRT